ncbi:MAG: hypothetical protein LBF84_04125 [Holosporales bacterium]|jgi:hypothetical protein|nr:hypothetical protein [Holosporales bacterium]
MDKIFIQRLGCIVRNGVAFAVVAVILGVQCTVDVHGMRFLRAAGNAVMRGAELVGVVKRTTENQPVVNAVLQAITVARDNLPNDTADRQTNRLFFGKVLDIVSTKVKRVKSQEDLRLFVNSVQFLILMKFAPSYANSLANLEASGSVLLVQALQNLRTVFEQVRDDALHPVAAPGGVGEAPEGGAAPGAAQAQVGVAVGAPVEAGNADGGGN